jgi:hypothetical protein
LELKDFKPTTKGKKWGLGLLIFGAFGSLTLLSQIFDPSQPLESSVGGAIFYAGVAAFGFYLLTSKKAAQRAQVKAEDKKAKRELEIQSELEFLKTASGAKASISYNKLRLLVLANKETYPEKRIDELLESIGFDKSRVESKMLGSVRHLGAPMFGGKSSRTIYIYKEWVIVGESGWDFDISTRGDVTVEGSITFDNKNNRQDMRTATLYLATQDWSQAFRIDPNQADEARRIINQLMAIIDELKPKGVTAADVQASMEGLVNKSGKSQGERLEELSNLRYQRLLTDQEFEAAKKKILEI